MVSSAGEVTSKLDEPLLWGKQMDILFWDTELFSVKAIVPISKSAIPRRSTIAAFLSRYMTVRCGFSHGTDAGAGPGHTNEDIGSDPLTSADSL
jgi:hypothetical protein